MTYNRFVLCAAVCLSTCAVDRTCYAVNISDELLFADGLLERGYFDLAQKQMSNLSAQRGLSSKDRAAVHFSAADLFIRISDNVLTQPGKSKEEKLRLKEVYLKLALENLDKGISLDRNNERSSKAIFQVGTILKDRALTKKKSWETMEDELKRIVVDPKKANLTEDERKKLIRKAEIISTVPVERASAVDLLNKAVKYFETLATQKEKIHKDLLDKVRNTKDSKRQAEYDKQAEAVEVEMVLAQYEWYSIQLYLGEIEGATTPKGKAAIEAAVKNLKVLGSKYSQWVIGKYVIMLEGFGSCMLENYESGFKKFSENTKEKNNEAIDDVIKKTYYRWASGAKDADPKKYPSKTYPPKNDLIIYLIEGLKYKATAEDAKAKLGLKEVATQYGVDAHELMKLNGLDSYVMPKGKEIVVYNGLLVRYDGVENESIGKASSILLAEAYVNKAKEQRAAKKPYKVWASSAQRGFQYAERIAQDQDAWSYKASLLLSEWDPFMKEIQYESPIQFYAQATTLFGNARQQRDATKRMAMYNECISKMQKVISLSGGESRAFARDKLVDAWFKIGACHYMTGRLREAALTWSECARLFPTEANGEKAGGLSATVMQKFFKDSSKADKVVVSHFYEEILVEFIRLFPNSLKAADSQFFVGEVIRTRGDNLRAAEAYGKVKASSRYYDKAIYLIGISYLNEFYKLYREEKGETPEAKSALDQADSGLGRYIKWVDDEQAPDAEVFAKRKSTQARALFSRATLFLFPVNEKPDTVLELLAGFESKYEKYLPASDQKTLFPQIIFNRLKAHVIKKDIDGANGELVLLLKYPESKDLANAFKYVAGVFMNEAEQKGKPLAGMKKKLEELQEKSDPGAAALAAEIVKLEGEVGIIRIKAADKYYELLTKAEGVEPSIYMFTADTYFLNEKYDRAAYIYQMFLKSYGNDPQFKDKILDIQFRAGQSYYFLKQYKSALALLAQVSKVYTANQDPKRFLAMPPSSHSYKEIGKELRAEKKMEEAQASFAQALHGWAILKNNYKPASEEWWEPNYEIAEIYYLQGDFEKCLSHLSSLSLLYPDMGGQKHLPRFIWILEQLEKLFAKDKAKVTKIQEILAKLKEKLAELNKK